MNMAYTPLPHSQDPPSLDHRAWPGIRRVAVQNPSDRGARSATHGPVSYTHLDVYKRQEEYKNLSAGRSYDCVESKGITSQPGF